MVCVKKKILTEALWYRILYEYGVFCRSMGKNYMAVVAPKAAAGGKKAKKDADKTAETK